MFNGQREFAVQSLNDYVKNYLRNPKRLCIFYSWFLTGLKKIQFDENLTNIQKV